MICELCGRQFERGVKLRIEGSVINSCRNCSNHGEVIEPVKSKPKAKKKASASPPKKPKKDFSLDIEYTLVDDYPQIVKNAREKRGLRQSQLGKLLQEPESVVHRIESGRFEPSPKLARALQKKLKIKLLEQVEPMDEVEKTDTGDKEFTLGDVVVLREKRR